MCIKTILSVFKCFIKKLFVLHETVIVTILRVTEFNSSSGVLPVCFKKRTMDSLIYYFFKIVFKITCTMMKKFIFD